MMPIKRADLKGVKGVGLAGSRSRSRPRSAVSSGFGGAESLQKHVTRIRILDSSARNDLYSLVASGAVSRHSTTHRKRR